MGLFLKLHWNLIVLPFFDTSEKNRPMKGWVQLNYYVIENLEEHSKVSLE
jgi:hypothetical protein